MLLHPRTTTTTTISTPVTMWIINRHLTTLPWWWHQHPLKIQIIIKTASSVNIIKRHLKSKVRSIPVVRRPRSRRWLQRIHGMRQISSLLIQNTRSKRKVVHSQSDISRMQHSQQPRQLINTIVRSKTLRSMSSSWRSPLSPSCLSWRSVSQNSARCPTSSDPTYSAPNSRRSQG